MQPTKKLSDFLYEIQGQNIPLESFVCPMPEDIKASMDSNGKDDTWYNWSIENWGTKW